MKKYKTIAILTVISMFFFNTGQGFAVTADNTKDNSTVITEDSSVMTSEAGVETAIPNPATDFSYTETTTGVTITGYNGTATTVVIPESINNLPVTTIATNAFKNSNIISISSATVTTIGESSFRYCFKLTSVYLPNLTTINGDYAFFSCQSLTAIDFPKLETVPNSTFANCVSLKNINLPVVKSLDESAFGTCKSLTEITLPQVEKIGNYAFNNCEKLISITANNVISIEYWAFGGCNSLSSVKIPLVKTVGSYAFVGCVSLTSIAMPAVTVINEESFAYCSALNNITISNKVTTISSTAFLKCSITNVTIDYGTDDISSITKADLDNFIINTMHLSADTILGKYANSTGMFKDFTGGLIYSMSDTAATVENYTGNAVNLIIPENANGKPVTTIGSAALSNITSLVSIDLNNVTTIGNMAFNNCPNLTTVIGNKVITLGDSSFQDCVMLKNLTLPEVTTIGSYTFNNCTALTSLTFNKLTKINGICSFNNCSNLTSVEFENLQNLGDNTFFNNSKLVNVKLPSVNKIGNFAFYGCTGLQTINFENLETIGMYAFSGCYQLNSINMKNVTAIGNNAFEKCIALPKAELPNLKTIGHDVFNGCTTLSTIIISNNASIGNNAFVNCPAINSITINYGILDITNVTLENWNNYVISMGLEPSLIPGKYIINNLGNKKELTNIAPIITLNGENTIYLEVNTPYIEPGFVITDDIDTDLQPIITGAVNTSNVGINYIYYNVVDSSGNSAAQVIRTVKVIEATAPVISLNGESTMTIIVGSTFIDPKAVVTDNYDTDLQAVVTGSVNANKVGVYTLTYNATDTFGNKAVPVTRTVKVIYNYSGLRQPVNSDGTSVFKAGSTVPVKFQLSDANGNFISTATANLSYAKISNNNVGPINEAISTSAATTGNLFRYSDNQYIFNLSTKGLTAGSYKLIITLDDGQTYSATIGLR